MCGINGIFLRNGSNLDTYDIVKTMCEITMHRGPDESNVWKDDDVTLGHNRLMIIDPIGGHQPFITNNIALTYNGEIYNYLKIKEKLKSEGVKFEEESDTEVLAKAIEKWGDGAVDYLNGDFAFASFDKTNKSLSLVRDRVGVKPLYYHVSNDYIIFSSECKAIIAALKTIDKNWAPKISKPGIIETFIYGQPIPPNSFYKDINSVQPGEIITFSTSNPTKSTRYWEPELKKGKLTKLEDINKSLREATRLRTQSDFDYSLMLSGGLDSSLLTYIVGDIEEGKNTYTLGEAKSSSHSSKSFMNGSDLDFAKLVSSEAKQNLVECYSEEPSIIQQVKEIALSKDSPVTLINEIGMSTVFNTASKKDKVIISGDGADELFLGYYMLTDISKGVDAFYSSKKSKLLFYLFNKKFLRRGEAVDLANNNFKQRLRDVPKEIKESPEHLMHYLQLRFTLPYLLDRADRISSSFSMELRVPYCDHNLIDHAFNLNKSMKITKVEKKALRDSFSADFNNDVIYRKKSVFPFSEEKSQIETLRKECLKLIRKGDSSVISQIFNVNHLRLIFESRHFFKLLAAFAGSFYLQALMCQIISIAHLESEHGLSA